MIVLGSNAAKTLFGTGQAVGETVRIKGQSLRVIGVLAPKGGGGFGSVDDQAFVPITVAQQLQGVQGISAADAITGEYDVIAVCEAEDVNGIGQLIVEKIQKVQGVFKTITCLAVR